MLAPVAPVTPSTETGGRSTVNGEQLWNTLEGKIKEMKVDVTFNNNQ